jgi:hypothetical protein
MAGTRPRQETENRAANGDFRKNVFINCPFDKKYVALLRPLLFTIIYLGLNPRIALESKNSGAPRIEKIVQLVRESLYAIHDLSRSKAAKRGELYRLNMPFELGLDVGCQRFSTGARRRKKCLVLDAETHQYQAAISDIAGSDIESHRNEPRELVVRVRNWLTTEARIRGDGPAKIWASFSDFIDHTSESLRNDGFLKRDIENLPTSELMRHMRTWCASKA